VAAMAAALERPACDPVTSDLARAELVVEVAAHLLGRGIKELRELLVDLFGSLSAQHADIQRCGSDATQTLTSTAGQGSVCSAYDASPQAPVACSCQSAVGTHHRGEHVMAVLVRHRVSGMTPQQYDESAPPLVEKLKTQPGFLYHVAFVDEGGRFTVSEIWESKEQHDRWFSENVEGVIPGVEQQVIEVHAVHTP
jgi:Antibiotic biosynthesis monooxygenase